MKSTLTKTVACSWNVWGKIWSKYDFLVDNLSWQNVLRRWNWKREFRYVELKKRIQVYGVEKENSGIWNWKREFRYTRSFPLWSYSLTISAGRTPGLSPAFHRTVYNEKSGSSKVPTRDVNLIFSDFNVYAAISKLIDQPVWDLVKNDSFTYWVCGNSFQNKKVKISTDIGLKRKHQKSKRNPSLCFLLSFWLHRAVVFWQNHVQICQRLNNLCKNISLSI
jgi:hypothetical protein